jgi:hypothetical protein
MRHIIIEELTDMTFNYVLKKYKHKTYTLNGCIIELLNIAKYGTDTLTIYYQIIFPNELKTHDIVTLRNEIHNTIIEPLCQGVQRYFSARAVGAEEVY